MPTTTAASAISTAVAAASEATAAATASTEASAAAASSEATAAASPTAAGRSFDHGHRDFDGVAVEFFVVEPRDGRLGGVGVVVRNRGFAFLLAGVSVFVDPDLLLSGLAVVLDHADGAEKLSQVFFNDVGGEAGDVNLVIGLDSVSVTAAASSSKTTAAASSETSAATTATAAAKSSSTLQKS